MSYKLVLHNFSVDGVVTDIQEGTTKGLVPERTLTFNYFNSKMLCNAKVTFASDKQDTDLYKPAVRFVTKLEYIKKNPRYSDVSVNIN